MTARVFTSPLTARLADALQRVFGGETLAEAACGDAQAQIDRDLDLLNAVLAGERAAPCLRLWTNGACIVLPRRFRSHAGFAEAEAEMKSLGWPIATRQSGGTAVLHRDGVLNVSLIDLWPGPISMPGLYRRLLDVMQAAFAGLGVQTDHGPVAGSYCDGEYNLRQAGRKLAGTSAVVRKRHGRTGILVHGALVVAGDVAADAGVLNRLEAALGEDRRYDPASLTSAEAALQSIEETAS